MLNFIRNAFNATYLEQENSELAAYAEELCEALDAKEAMLNDAYTVLYQQELDIAELETKVDGLRRSLENERACFEFMESSAAQAWSLALAPRHERILRDLFNYSPLTEAQGKFW